MRLRDSSYQKILNSTKNIEVRPLDEKRKNVQLGDHITFINKDNSKDFPITKKVIALLHYATFSDIINDFNIDNFGYQTKEEYLSILYLFYSKEDEKRYGVLGIKLGSI